MSICICAQTVHLHSCSYVPWQVHTQSRGEKGGGRERGDKRRGGRRRKQHDLVMYIISWKTFKIRSPAAHIKLATHLHPLWWTSSISLPCTQLVCWLHSFHHESLAAFFISYRILYRLNNETVCFWSHDLTCLFFESNWLLSSLSHFIVPLCYQVWIISKFVSIICYSFVSV